MDLQDLKVIKVQMVFLVLSVLMGRVTPVLLVLMGNLD